MRLAILGPLLLAGLEAAGGRPDPGVLDDLLELVRAVGNGNETCTHNERGIVIAYDAMTYQVHVPDRLGRLQRAQEQLGPNRDGVVLEIDMRDQPYGGPMGLPQCLRGPYYATYCSEVREGPRYLFVRARFGVAFPAQLRQRILARVGAVERRGPPVRVGCR